MYRIIYEDIVLKFLLSISYSYELKWWWCVWYMSDLLPHCFVLNGTWDLKVANNYSLMHLMKSNKDINNTVPTVYVSLHLMKCHLGIFSFDAVSTYCTVIPLRYRPVASYGLCFPSWHHSDLGLSRFPIQTGYI